MVVPPFAEEMNKCRAIVAEMAAALAARGEATLVPDLFGTGDSDGEFRDADWASWQSDLATAAHWSAARGWPVKALLCIRLGCALGAEFARDSGLQLKKTVFWQPVTDGERYISQLLRIRVAADMMGDHARETTKDLRGRWAAGETLEIAGYEISARLAKQIESVRLLSALGPWLGEVQWLEVVGEAMERLPSAERIAAAATTSAAKVTTRAIVGEPFWSTVELVRAETLLAETVAVLTGQA
jgi:exosortase A-associated hydrolase 2